jgi:triosephosphate isomerase
MAVGIKLIAGNWKMNGLRAALAEVSGIASGATALGGAAQLALCPPATLAALAAEVLNGSDVALGGQDCHTKSSGAHTGDVSAEMWADLGARYVIVGHSERRADHGETDAVVHAKALAVARAGLTPIICVGESLAVRDSGDTLQVVARQIRMSVPAGIVTALVIAYEPIWAIGTGRTPTPAQVAEVHAMIRTELTKLFPQTAGAIHILYGGSVKPENAGELLNLPDVDGALVGGASLKAADFLAIARAAIGR